MSLIHSAKRAVQRTGIKTVKKVIALRRQSFLRQKKPFEVTFNTTSKKNYAAFGRRFVEKFNGTVVLSKDGLRFSIGQSDNFASESSHRLTIDCILREEVPIDFAKVKNVHIPLSDGRPKLASVALGFEKDTLIIEAIQENSKQKKLRNEFWRTTKTRPVERLFLEVEAHARKLGFKQIKIRRPETLYYYEHPVNETGGAHYHERKTEVQAGMRASYNKLAKKNGYTKGEFFYTKTL
jgi:hypothetical protein